jgi:hypothetical protein
VQLRPVRRSLVVVVLSVVVGGGCGGDDKPSSDAGTVVRRGQLMISTSDSRGVVRVGTAVGAQSDVLLVDSETQKPIAGALAEAVEEDGDDGYLVRISKDAAGYRPEVVRCRRGQPHTVPLGSSTADVRGRAVRVSAKVHQDEFVGEFDLAGVNMVAERETRPEILFLPALDETAMTGARFAVYLSVLPQTLFAVKQEGVRATGPTVVRGQARVVSTSGARRGGARVKPLQIAAAGERHAGEELPAPALSSLSVVAPDASGAGLLRWNLDDPMGRVIAFEVGIDTTVPQRRLAKELRELAFEARRGDHLACVRPVFAGADVDPVIRCLQFAAPQAPAASSVRVSIKPPALPAPVTARRGMPVAVEVSNEGEVDAPGFFLDVVVSRDGRLEGGLGQVRSVWIDGIKAGGRTTRTTDITPPRDGQLFLVARADGLRTLVEANPEDNVDRSPLEVVTSGNKAPLVSVAGTAVGASAGAILEGEAIKLLASADDAEDGDLSAGITWYSSRDGMIGQGAALDTKGLSPGVHRLRAEVSDTGKGARIVKRGPVGRGLDRGRAGIGADRLVAGAERADAEMQIEVLARNAPAGNTPPRLSAGPDQTTTVGGEVFPAATAIDADGDPLNIFWTVTGEDGTSLALEGARDLRPRFQPPAAGVYRMVVTVSDGKASEKDDLVVTVLSAASNRAPLVTVTLPAEGRAGVALVAKVEASDEDQDGLTLSYALDRPQGSAALLIDAETRTPGFLPDLGGFYKLTVRAEDGRGGLAVASAAVMVMGTVGPGPVDAAIPQDAADPDAGAGPDTVVVVRDGGDTEVAGPRFDAGPSEAVPPDQDGGPADFPPVTTCEPVQQQGCVRAEDACYVSDGTFQCLLPGPGVEGIKCTQPGDCLGGSGCFAEPEGSFCRQYCDPQQPACPAVSPICNVLPRSRYGVCIPYKPPTPAPDGGPTVACDPVKQLGCTRVEDACFAFPQGDQACLLPGSGKPNQSQCDVHSDCITGSGCFDGPEGRFCRSYCDVRAPSCSTEAPFCAGLGGSQWGICLPPSQTTDAAPLL